MNKRYYEHTLPIIRGSLSNTYTVKEKRTVRNAKVKKTKAKNKGMSM